MKLMNNNSSRDKNQKIKVFIRCQNFSLPQTAPVSTNLSLSSVGVSIRRNAAECVTNHILLPSPLKALEKRSIHFEEPCIEH